MHNNKQFFYVLPLLFHHMLTDFYKRKIYYKGILALLSGIRKEYPKKHFYEVFFLVKIYRQYLRLN